MTKQHKQFFLTALVLVFVLSMTNTNLYPRMMFNGGDCIYETETCTEGTSESNNGIVFTGPVNRVQSTQSNIGVYVVNGAGYFLKSQSAALLFLNKIEMSDLEGVDFNDLRAALYEAIAAMELSKNSYNDLKQTADITPYKSSMIAKLKNFDYDGFQKKRGLNSVIFNRVEEYLAHGDVNGLFGEVLSRTGIILDKLYRLKDTVEKDQLPLNQDLWKLAQEYSELHMGGQYAAQVFYEVTSTSY